MHVIWHIASCCSPLPGDPITGITNKRNNTVRVHHSNCPNLEQIKPKKLCFPAWNCGYCSVQILLFMNDRPDTFRPVLDLLANRSSKPDLRDVQISKDGKVRAAIRLPVASRQDLDGIVTQIKNMPSVVKVKITKLIPWTGIPEDTSRI